MFQSPSVPRVSPVAPLCVPRVPPRAPVCPCVAPCVPNPVKMSAWWSFSVSAYLCPVCPPCVSPCVSRGYPVGLPCVPRVPPCAPVCPACAPVCPEPCQNVCWVVVLPIRLMCPVCPRAFSSAVSCRWPCAPIPRGLAKCLLDAVLGPFGDPCFPHR